MPKVARCGPSANGRPAPTVPVPARVLLVRRRSCRCDAGLADAARVLLVRRGSCWCGAGLAGAARVLLVRRGSQPAPPAAGLWSGGHDCGPAGTTVVRRARAQFYRCGAGHNPRTRPPDCGPAGTTVVRQARLWSGGHEHSFIGAARVTTRAPCDAGHNPRPVRRGSQPAPHNSVTTIQAASSTNSPAVASFTDAV